ncbi:hypothetical protein MMC25_000793, partial [Agyrium rufum]|nr:hypothetical protein [Agyrium rufum]
GAELSPFARWNVLRPFVHRYYNRQMEVYLRREIASCFKAHRDKDNRNAKTILGLAIDGYQSSKESKDSTELDQTFIPFAMAQMKGLILAGHGTTANTICYVYHNLSKHPTALASVRAEHAQILGPDPHATILQNPHVLNQLPFTLAVIKETLRLFPADSSPRRGNPDFFLRDESDKAYPTDKCLVWSMPQAIHRSPKWWPRPDEFIPERFLVPEGHELHPVKGAWRAFEFGPRNCVGQELALSEMKIVLALTIRRFSVQAAYEEWEEMKGMKPRDVAGEKAYQVLDGTNRPRGGFPCRVTLVDE